MSLNIVNLELQKYINAEACKELIPIYRLIFHIVYKR